MASIPQQRPSPIADLLDRVTRERLEAFISAAVDLLDLADGDADDEPDGDELDGSTAEDDFCPVAPGIEPGDPTDAEPDDEDEAAYPEWTSLPGSTKQAGHITTGLLPTVFHNDEDAEDDDPDQCLAEEDLGTKGMKRRGLMGFGNDSGLNDPEGDYGGEEPGELDETDIPGECSDADARREHRDRIRRTRCDKTVYRNPFNYRDRVEYRLRDHDGPGPWVLP